MSLVVAQTVCEVETLGVQLRVEADHVVVRFPAEDLRQELSGQLVFLRAHRHEVMNYLRERSALPVMPPGVRLVSWHLKEPPVAIETCAIVTNPSLFARITIGQLAIALTNPRRWCGWTVPQLLDHLAQVGVILTLNQSPQNSRRETMP